MNDIKGQIEHRILSNGQPLRAYLQREFSLSTEQLTLCENFSSIYLNKDRIKNFDIELKPLDYVRAHLNPRRFPVGEVDWQKTIVFEHEDFLVVNKPKHIPTHATVDNFVENVVYQFSLLIKSPTYCTHRLDKLTVGFLVIAKTQPFQTYFNKQLAHRQVSKKYRALTTAAPAIGMYKHYMDPNRRCPKILSAEPKEGFQECVLEVLSVQETGKGFLVCIDLHTGRSHQIRAQLAFIGCPLVGDPVYGNHEGEFFLECYSLSFKYHGEQFSYEL